MLLFELCRKDTTYSWNDKKFVTFFFLYPRKLSGIVTNDRSKFILCG